MLYRCGWKLKSAWHLFQSSALEGGLGSAGGSQPYPDRGYVVGRFCIIMY